MVNECLKLFCVNSLMHNWLSCLHMCCGQPFRSIPPTIESLIIDVFEHYQMLRVNVKTHGKTFHNFYRVLLSFFFLCHREIKGFSVIWLSEACPAFEQEHSSMLSHCNPSSLHWDQHCQALSTAECILLSNLVSSQPAVQVMAYQNLIKR